MLTAFDFFRFSRMSMYDTVQKDGSVLSPWKSSLKQALFIRETRLKCKNALLKFIKEFKEGTVRMPKALVAIRFLEEHRKIKR